jgi:hypothetical protein
MYERKKKPTLEQVRTLFPFDPAALAGQARVSTTTVYHALVMQPISQEDAGKMLVALSQHTGLQLSLEQVDIVTWEKFDMLWVVRASSINHELECGEVEDHYHLVYARDREHAAIQAYCR